MRSERLRIGWACLALCGVWACSHAEPTPTPDVTPAAEAATPEPAQPAPAVAADQGEKLASSEDALAQVPPKPKAPERVADPAVRQAFDDAMRAALGGDSDAAIAQLQRALERNPNLPWAHFDLGALYERKGQDDAALGEYRKAMDAEPGFGAAAMAEARLLLRKKRIGEADADLRNRIQAHPDALGLRVALVFALVQEGQLEGAMTEAKKVLKVDEKNTDAMFQLATVYYKQHKYELAEMVLKNANAIRPDDPQIHNALGFVHIALEAKAQAFEDFKQAAALSPDFVEAHNNLGALYNEAQDYPSAVKELELAVRDAPDFLGARLNLGNAYRGNQQYEKAQSEYQRVLQLHPNDKDALFNLAVLYFDGEFAGVSAMDRLSKAGQYFDQYRAAGGDDPKVDQYKKDLAKLLDKEKRRLEREEKDKLRKAKKAQEEAAKAQKEAASHPAMATDHPADAQPASAVPSKPSGGGKLGGGDEK